MLGIADIWQEIKENDAKYGTKRSNLLLESIAGKNRANIASSILESPDLLREAFDYSAKANGSAMRENEKYLDSITGKLNQLKTAYQELGETAVSSDFLKVLTEMGTTGLEGLTKYVNMFGTLPSLIPLAFGGAGALGGGFFNMDKNGNMSYPIFEAFKKKSTFSLTNDDKNFIDEVRRLQSANGNILGDVNNINAIASGYENISGSIKEAVESSSSLEVMDANINILSQSTSKAKDMFKAFGATFANVAMNMAAGIAIDLAIKGIMYLYDQVAHAREHIQEAMDSAQSSIDEANKSFESQSSSIENVKKRYAELSEGVRVTSSEIKNMNLSDEEFNEYLNLNKQLSELAPDLVSGYDTQGNALMNLGDNYSEVSGNIDEYIDKLREARNLEVANNMGDLFAGAYANVNDLKKEEDILRTAEGIKDQFLDVRGGSDQFKTMLQSGLKSGTIQINANEIQKYEAVLDRLGVKYNAVMQIESDVVTGYALSLTSSADDLAAASEKIESVIKSGEINNDLNKNLEKQKAEWQKLSGSMLQALQSTDSYKMLNDQASDAFQSVFNNLDLGQIIENNNIGNDWGLLESWFNDNLITQISSVSSEVNEALDMQEQFDNNEIVAKDYIDNLSKLFSSDKIKNLAPEIQDALHSAFTDTFQNDQSFNEAFDILSDKYSAGLIKNLNDYKTIIKEMNDLGVDASNTIFGNIDTNNRQVLEWTAENIEKYRSQIESWGKNPDDFFGSISTVFGASGEFDGQEIAFSPMLQTDHGAELLNKDTVYNYINSLIQEAGKDGKGWTNEELFSLDTKGLEVDGKMIKGLLADIGDTAITTADAMHYVGENGALQDALSGLSEDAKDFQEYLGTLNKEQIQILVDIYEPGMTIDECDKKIKELQATAAEGIDLNARTDIEEYEKVKKAGGSYLKDYNKYRDMLKAGQEFYNNGQIGNEEYKAIAKAFSVNKMSDVTNWEENSAQLGKYFTEDARDGLYVFLEDLEKIGVASRDASDNWTMNFEDMEDAANKLYMPVEMLNTLLAGTTEYGFTNDFFGSVEQGTAHLTELLKEQAQAHDKLDKMQNNPDLVDANGNALNEQIALCDELDGRVEDVKKHLRDMMKVDAETLHAQKEEALAYVEALQEQINGLDKEDPLYASMMASYLDEMQRIAQENHLEVPVDLQVNNPNVDTNINKEGKIVVDIAVNNEEDLESAKQAMEAIPEEDRKDVIFNYDVQNPKLLDKAQKQANEFATDYNATINVNDKASKQITKASGLADDFGRKEKYATIGVNDKASSKISWIQSLINGVHGKTVEITTKMTTIKNTIFGKGGNGGAIGTTGFVSSHATGTVLGGMKAYFGGHNIALSEDQKALVGEEGVEGLVRDGQFYLIGENSPEIKDLKKGDIIFSAKQTKAILNGQKTTRGKTIGMASHAEGTTNVMSGSYITAFADGLLNAYAGRGSGRGNLGRRSSSSNASNNRSNNSSSSTKATNNNTRALNKNTQQNKTNNRTQQETNSNLEDLQKRWDSLEDWIDDWIAAWDRTYNEYELYANEIHQNFTKQNAYIDKMYSQIDNINNHYSDMYSKYMRQAAASGLPEAYAKRVQGNTIDIQSITDEKLKAQIEEYKRWYDLAQSVRTKIIELRAEQSKLADQKLTNIQDDYEKLADISSNTLEYWKQAISLRKTLGRSYKSAITANGTAEMDGRRYYSNSVKDNNGKKIPLRSRAAADSTSKNVIDYNTNLSASYGYALEAQKRILNTHKNEYAKLNKEFNTLIKKGKIKKNDDVWKAWTASLKEMETQIYADREAFAQLKEELMEYHWEGFNNNIETIEYTLKELGDVLDHINENNLFSKEGKITKDGLSYIGTIGIALGEANQELVNYQSAVKTLEKQYRNGNISQEKYTEKLREYLDVIRSTSASIDDYKDKLVDLYMNQMKAENDALKENISLRQENLKRLREYDSYAKTIRDKNKNINSIQAQMASLSGTNTREGRAELARLRAQLQEAQEDLADTQKEHRWDMIDQGFSDMADNADKTLEEVTDKLERSTELQTKIVNQMLDNIKSSYKTTYDEINKIVTNSGIVLSNKTETDINRLSTKGGVNNTITKAEGTVSYNNTKNVSTGSVKPDSVTTSVKTTVELVSLKLNKTSASIQAGKTIKLTATKNPIVAQGAITWSTSNAKVATVNDKGVVKGIAAGTAIITATCSGKTAKCTVKVTKAVTKGKTATTKTTKPTKTIQNKQNKKATQIKKTSKKNTTAKNISNGGLAIRKSPGNKQQLLATIPSGKNVSLVLDSSGRYQVKKADSMEWMKVKYAGKTGWAKRKYLKYAKGSRKIKEDQIGITQDAGAEMIMSRGRMLVPTQLFKGDTVYPNDITEKLWDIGKLGTEGIKDKIERDLQIKVHNGLNGIKENTENNFGDYNVTINALQKLDRREIQELSDYFYNDWYKRMKKDLAASGIKR